MNDRILLIRTGGTIDAESYDDPQKPPKYVSTLKGDESLLMSTVAKLPNGDHVDGMSWTTVEEGRFVKDSQLFDSSDIKALAAIIKNDTNHKYFVLTHGTDAMIKNAEALKKELAGTDKVVAFVGAMVPLSMNDKHGSDGAMALTHALERISEQSAGVYIVSRDVANTKRMTFFDPESVEKDRIKSLENLQFTVAHR